MCTRPKRRTEVYNLDGTVLGIKVNRYLRRVDSQIRCRTRVRTSAAPGRCGANLDGREIRLPKRVAPTTPHRQMPREEGSRVPGAGQPPPFTRRARLSRGRRITWRTGLTRTLVLRPAAPNISLALDFALTIRRGLLRETRCWQNEYRAFSESNEYIFIKTAIFRVFALWRLNYNNYNPLELN